MDYTAVMQQQKEKAKAKPEAPEEETKDTLKEPEAEPPKMAKGKPAKAKTGTKIADTEPKKAKIDPKKAVAEPKKTAAEPKVKIEPTKAVAEPKKVTVTPPKGGPASAEVEEARKKLGKLIDEIQKIFIGQESVVHAVAVGLLAQGNILLEGAPGLGKTLLVRVLSECVDLKYSRIQFTPDLMPADITGTQALVRAVDGSNDLVFKPGPIFANIVLADEINRATPKTQSALLEAMQEHAVTVSGERMVLEEPFFVLATQNPLEMEGTYPLPEAQMDRFLLKVDVCFPSFDVLRDIGTLTTAGELDPVSTVMTGIELVALQKLLRRIVCAPHVSDYAAKLTLATHPTSDTAPDLVEKYVQYGASPRAMQALLLCGRAEAMLDGRPWVSTEDIQKVTHAVLRHRMILRFEAELEEIAPDEIVDAVLKATPTSHAH